MPDRPTDRRPAGPTAPPPSRPPVQVDDGTAVRPAAAFEQSVAPPRERVQGGPAAQAGRRTSSAPDEEKRSSPAARATSSGAKRAPRQARRARLRLTRIDPWSVMKTAFLLSIAFGIVTVVSVLMVWTVLGAAGVWESINTTVRDMVGGDTAATFDIENYLGTSRVLGFTMIVAAIDVILITAIATLAAFLYNMAASLLGGLELTLAEDR